MNDVPLAPCRECGTPKRIDTQCAANPDCIAREAEFANDVNDFVAKEQP